MLKARSHNILNYGFSFSKCFGNSIFHFGIVNAKLVFVINLVIHVYIFFLKENKNLKTHARLYMYIFPLHIYKTLSKLTKLTLILY